MKPDLVLSDLFCGESAAAIQVIEDLMRAAMGGFAGETASRHMIGADLVSFLERHRVVPTVPIAWFDEELGEVILKASETASLVQMGLEATAITTRLALDSAGIRCCLLKGLASAHLDYPVPEMRHTGDVDLLIPPTGLVDAVRVLMGLDYEPIEGQRLERWSRGITLTSPQGWDVDLHTRPLHRRPQRRGSNDHLAAEVVPLGRHGLAALSRPARLVHASGHFLATPRGKRRASGLIDVAVIAAATTPAELAEARDLARRWRVERLLEVSLGLVGAGSSGKEIRLSTIERRAFLSAQERWSTTQLWIHGWALPLNAPYALRRAFHLRNSVKGRRGYARPSFDALKLKDSPVSPQTRLEISGNVIWRCVGGAVLVIDIDSQRLARLTGLGVEIWRLLDERGRSIRELADLLAADAAIDAFDIARPIGEVCETLVGSGLASIKRNDAEQH